MDLATEVGYDAWVTPEPAQTLEDFQIAVAAAEAWHTIRHIDIIELRHILRHGRSLVKAFKFLRLK